MVTLNKKDIEMEKLNVRFPDKQKLQIEDLSEVIDHNTSTIARAAMQLGLEVLREKASKDTYSAKTTCMLKALEAMQ